MNLAAPVRGKVKQFDRHSTPDGYAVQFEDWRYPIAIDAKTGVVKYDNYGGQWGDEKHLNKFTQLYAKHALIAAAQRQGMHVQQHVTETGKIQLRLVQSR